MENAALVRSYDTQKVGVSCTSQTGQLADEEKK